VQENIIIPPPFKKFGFCFLQNSGVTRVKTSGSFRFFCVGTENNKESRRQPVQKRFGDRILDLRNEGLQQD
jgi:hypothetical protein